MIDGAWHPARSSADQGGGREQVALGSLEGRELPSSRDYQLKPLHCPKTITIKVDTSM